MEQLGRWQVVTACNIQQVDEIIHGDSWVKLNYCVVLTPSAKAVQ
jgi:hypothetical protein